MLFFIQYLHLPVFLVIFFNSIAILIFGIINQQIMSIIIDKINMGHFLFQFYGASFWSLVFILFWFMGEVFSFLGNFFTSRVYPELEKNIRIWTFNYVQKLYLPYLSQTSEGFLENYIDCAAEGVREYLQGMLEEVIPSLIFIICGIIYFCFIYLPLGILTILWLTLHIFVYSKLAVKTINLCKTHAQIGHERTAIMIDSLKNYQTKRILGLEEYSFDHIKDKHNNEKTFFQKYLIANGNMNFSISLLIILFESLVLFILIKEVLNKSISVGVLLSTLNISFWIIWQVWDRSQKLTSIVQNYSQTLQSLELIKKAPEDLIVGEYRPHSINWNISFKNLSFYYGKKKIFSNFSLDIKNGTKVAIIGTSGAGKSTLLNIITRMVDIERNFVYLDGVDLCEYAPKYLRSKIAYITQRNSLFDSNIYENIAIGKIGCTFEQVIEASKRAQLHDLVMDLDLGYNTRVGIGGSLLSGGQVQRICIARAMLNAHEGNMFICDEPTSSLDIFTAKEIISTILDITKNQTLIWIDHSMYVAPYMDIIVIMRPNEIVVGNHYDLLKNDSNYARLFE